jgi:hypothetical protein
MRRLRSVGILGTLLVVIACGGSESGSTSGKVTNCSSRGERSVAIDGDDLPVLFGSNIPNGEIVVEVLEASDLPDEIVDEWSMEESFIARGNFVGIRYRLINNLEEEIQLSSQFSESLRITNGRQSWGVADYNGDHFGAPGWAWSVQNGDTGGATYVPAGFDDVTWAVFDIPDDVAPDGLGFVRGDGKAVCFDISELAAG